MGIAEGCKEDKAGWSGFLAYLKKRGLTCPELCISDKCIGLIESLAEYYPAARWQRCTVHWYRNVLSVVPRGKMQEVAAMLKAIHAQEDAEAARIKAQAVVEKLTDMRLSKAVEAVGEGVDETLSYFAFPRSTIGIFIRTTRWRQSISRFAGGRGSSGLSRTATVP